MGHVFVSYCRDDRDYVDKLVGFLSERGVPVWLDDHRAPGDRWMGELRRRIEEAEALVVVMSHASSRSDWVQIEVELAREVGRPIVPLLLDGAPFDGLRQYADVTGRRMPGEAFLARLRSAPTAPPAGMPARMVRLHPEQVPDVIDVREDCATAGTVLALIGQMLRVLLTTRPEVRLRHGAAAVTIGAVKVVLPREYGRRGRIRPLRVDDAVAGGYEGAALRVRKSIEEVAADKSLAKGQLRDRRGIHRSAGDLSDLDRLGPHGVDARLRRALRATEEAKNAANALDEAVNAIGVDVCGFDLSRLVVDELERLEGFLWDSTTRWPRTLVDAVFERSISAGDGTMIMKNASSAAPPTKSGRI